MRFGQNWARWFKCPLVHDLHRGKNAYGKPQHDWKIVDRCIATGFLKSDLWDSKVIAKEARA
jgi:hypothetical protein